MTSPTTNTYAVLGSTGNCGTALIQNLLARPNAHIRAYCRNRSKLIRLLPGIDSDNKGRVTIFEGSIQDPDLLSASLRGARAVFLVISTNDNIPGYRAAKDTAVAVVSTLRGLREEGKQPPKLVLLSSATIDDQFSRHVPYALRSILLRSASHVYADVIEAERVLRAEESWLTSIFMKPGALSVDIQRGHALSLTNEESPVSYLDLAGAMIEAVDDKDGSYDGKNVSVVNVNGKAKFPTGTPMCIAMGLLRHFFPFLHAYLPTTGPK
ncbi:hypothetical protein HK57_00205 [Aspergillus ustus]|uniref:NAD(P)-binding domain-containing protein n=1 Tax=Aspergillus ustus TaxID=40382 RepID=A0A0C1BUU0_ASPUT|nr:hypothetical protein HK57_00205 [Aspergillus ustus]